MNRKWLIPAILHWILSFATDRLIFKYQLFEFGSFIEIAKSVVAWGTKAVFLLLLIVSYQLLGRAYRGIVQKNTNTKKYLLYTGIYLGSMLVFFMCTYPGIWRMDEFGILNQAVYLNPVFWQHYLTSVFYIFALMLIPVPAGIVLVQIMLISLIVGYLLYRMDRYLGGSKWTGLFYIPFLLFPVIDSNLYPMRMSIYAFGELLLVAKLLFIHLDKSEISKKDMILLAALTGMVAVWRTEAFYYVVAAPVIFCVLLWKQTSKVQKIRFTCFVFAASVCLYIPQYLGNRMVSGDGYEITSFVLPLPYLAEAELASCSGENGTSEALKAIDAVFDLDILLEGHRNGMSGISVFWNYPELIRPDYTEEEYLVFKESYYQLIAKYPEVFMQERMETFLHSNGVLQDTTQLYTTETIANYVQFREGYKGNKPINNELRSFLISLLDCRNIKDYAQVNVLHGILWNFLPQAILLVLLTLVLMIRKKWGYALLAASVAVKMPLVFLTAPSRLFMYYYPVYLIGSVAAVFVILALMNKKYKWRK